MPRRSRLPVFDRAALRATLDAARLFHARGWVPASAGNFSFRLDAGTIAVTVSGRHKGELGPADFLRVDLHGHPLERKKSSAETLLHCQIYRRFPAARAVLHTHSPASTALSRARRSLRLEGYELLKVFDGIVTHEAAVDVPVFENDQDIARLATVVDAQMATGRGLHGYLIRGHGLYAWGDSVAQARHRVEALEFLFECELAARLLERSDE
ncbi:MAG TPA: methylthioribulose 1-phosphate dehydratase [Candidatus Binatia bacterium]|nr:methylthioribulose 1-phosphate dehydratase [Candidatus Binatia bacterium]